MPQRERNGKKPRTIANEASIVRRWIAPIVGNIPLKGISPFDLEKMKSKMLKAGKTPRTIEYALAIVRQVHNLAVTQGLLDCACPVKRVKTPRRDNRRLAFLSHEQADALLEELVKQSHQARTAIEQ
ncbi:MAG: hypothetical protein LDL27_08680 [Desulfovibrio sp.]|nr:hypothetical protein [Desulfovibrio sp.]